VIAVMHGRDGDDAQIAALVPILAQRETTRLSLRRSWSNVGAEVVQVHPGATARRKCLC